jgi:hypothetical protein
MTADSTLISVFGSQSSIGAFPSTIHSGDKRHLDWNGFTTAQVLRALRDFPESDPLNNARNLALDFLKRCESPKKPGAFHFWPKGMKPVWIPELPSDADDTSIILIEMVRNKRIDIRTARIIAQSVLLPHRVIEVPKNAPSWIRFGAFFTWLRPGPFNIVDCCVNANVIALLSYIGLDGIEGFNETCEMIEEGIKWSGGFSFSARTLTPFYPHPTEFVYAIDHAIECGAKQLEESFELMRDFGWVQDNDKENSNEKPICGNAYSGDIWYSQVLNNARKLGKIYSKTLICPDVR